MACSFQKEESVLIDMLMRIEPSARVFTIDTGVLFPETYEVWRKVEDRYGLRVEVVDATPPNGTPWSASNCCGARKVDALERALAGTRGLDHGHPARAVAHAGRRRSRSNGTSRAASGSSIRSRIGPTATCGATCTSTISPTIPSTTGAMSRSAAPPARSPATAEKAAGPVRTRPSAACT